MIEAFYFQQLCFATLPFFPLMAFMMPIFMFITFKFEMFILQRYLAKPKKPWSAKVGSRERSVEVSLPGLPEERIFCFLCLALLTRVLC